MIFGTFFGIFQKNWNLLWKIWKKERADHGDWVRSFFFLCLRQMMVLSFAEAFSTEELRTLA